LSRCSISETQRTKRSDQAVGLSSGITFKPVPHGRSLERSGLESRAIDSANKAILSRFLLDPEVSDFPLL
jgi:hypothetical protein